MIENDRSKAWPRHRRLLQPVVAADHRGLGARGDLALRARPRAVRPRLPADAVTDRLPRLLQARGDGPHEAGKQRARRARDQAAMARLPKVIALPELAAGSEGF